MKSSVSRKFEKDLELRYRLTLAASQTDQEHLYLIKIAYTEKQLHLLEKDKDVVLVIMEQDKEAQSRFLGKYFFVLGLIKDYDEISLIKDHFPINSFSPYINLLIKMGEERYRERKLDGDLVILSKLQDKIKSKSFREELRLLRKGISKNKQSVLRYIKSLFEYRSQLLVIRIDLNYKKDKNNQLLVNLKDENNDLLARKKTIDFSLGALQADSILAWSNTVRDDRNELIKRIRKQYGKDLVGYIWKLEYGTERAFHYHMIFFLDASKHQQDIKICENIGELWKKEITNGKGEYWNCNANKKNFEKNNKSGVGKIKHNEKEDRKNLDHMASYLTKGDYFVRTVLPKGARTLGKGGIMKKAKLGRPRE